MRGAAGVLAGAALGISLLGACRASSAASGFSPRYGIHTSYGLVLAYQDMAEFVRVCAERGYRSIMYMILSSYPDSTNGSAGYRFVSPTLERLGWTFERDDLAELVAETATRGIDLYVDLQDLAYLFHDPGAYPQVSPPTASDVAGLVQEVAAYGVTGIAEELFPSQWVEPVSLACQSAGLRYIHKAVHWDFGGHAGTGGCGSSIRTLPPTSS